LCLEERPIQAAPGDDVSVGFPDEGEDPDTTPGTVELADDRFQRRVMRVGQFQSSHDFNAVRLMSFDTPWSP
jgi:hypothetical protein